MGQVPNPGPVDVPPDEILSVYYERWTLMTNLLVSLEGMVGGFASLDPTWIIDWVRRSSNKEGYVEAGEFSLTGMPAGMPVWMGGIRGERKATYYSGVTYSQNLVIRIADALCNDENFVVRFGRNPESMVMIHKGEISGNEGSAYL